MPRAGNKKLFMIIYRFTIVSYKVDDFIREIKIESDASFLS